MMRAGWFLGVVAAAAMGCGTSAGTECYTSARVQMGTSTYERACANLPTLCRDGLTSYGNCNDPVVTNATSCTALLVLATGLGGENAAKGIGCLAQNTTRAGYNACASACGVNAVDAGAGTDASTQQDAGPAAPSLAGRWRRTDMLGNISLEFLLNITGDGQSGNPPMTHTWVATNTETRCVTTTVYMGALTRNSETTFTFSPTAGTRATTGCTDASGNIASAALMNDEFVVGSFANQMFTVTATELRLAGTPTLVFTRQ